MSEQPRPDFLLGDWRVCPGRNRLVRDDEEVRVEPRVMDLLVYLADHQSEVVPQQRLVDEVWPYHVVARSALSRTLTLLRQALGDDARKPRYVETIPKRGYRLVAEVRPLGEPERPAGVGCGLLVSGRWVRLVEGTTLIGRSPAADLQLDAPGVSRRHASISIAGTAAVVEDLGSKNGTFVDGRRIDEATALADEAKIVIGHEILLFRRNDPSRSTETIQPQEA